MAQEGKPPESGPETDAPAEAAAPDDARATKRSSLSADAEKDAQVEAAKPRVTAAKEAAQKAAPAAGAPKPPVKKKEEGPKPVDASNHPLVRRLRDKFADAIGEASEFLGQLSVHVGREHIVDVCKALKSDAETRCDYLSRSEERRVGKECRSR